MKLTSPEKAESLFPHKLENGDAKLSLRAK
jgi:hypothetical protein